LINKLFKKIINKDLPLIFEALLVAGKLEAEFPFTSI